METLDRHPTRLTGGMPYRNGGDGQETTAINTLEVSPTERLKYWKSQVSLGHGVDLLCSTTNFVGRCQARDLGGFTVSALETRTPHRAVRLAARSGICFVNIQEQNDGALFRGATEWQMKPGTLSVYEAIEGYEIDFPGNTSSVVVALPKQWLKSEVMNFDRHLEMHVDYDRQLVAMLGALCNNFLRSRSVLKQAALDGVAGSILHLLVSVFNNADLPANDGATTGQLALLARLKAHVRANIAEPDLSPATVAARLGITVSYLHKVFRAEGTTLMQFVLAERLERCRRDIARSGRTANISQIAFANGFNDASHFTRSFRARFGASPRQYRQSVTDLDRQIAK